MSPALVDDSCRPLPRGTPPLEGRDVELLLAELHAGWRVQSGPELARTFRSNDYPSLVRLAAGIGALAERSDHHPELALAFGRLDVALSTHSIGGLSRNDFVLAAGIDRLAEPLGP
jgi:4a-hydroxytetrahydrobiopterin dehydratase